MSGNNFSTLIQNLNIYLTPKTRWIFPLGTENAKGYSAKDHKEFFHFYPWGKVPSTVSNSTRSCIIA